MFKVTTYTNTGVNVLNYTEAQIKEQLSPTNYKKLTARKSLIIKVGSVTKIYKSL